MSGKPNVIDVENFKSVRVAQDDPLVVDVSEATDNTIVYRFESDKPFSHGTAVLSQDDVTVAEATQSGGKYVWSAKSQFAVNSKLVVKSSEAEGVLVNGKAIIYEGKDPSEAIPLLDKVEFSAPAAQQPSYLMIAVGVALLALFLYIIVRN